MTLSKKIGELILENIRFNKLEELNDADFAKVSQNLEMYISMRHFRAVETSRRSQDYKFIRLLWAILKG